MNRADIETILEQVQQRLATAGALPEEAEQAVEMLHDVIETISSDRHGLAAEVERLRQDLEKKKAETNQQNQVDHQPKDDRSSEKRQRPPIPDFTRVMIYVPIFLIAALAFPIVGSLLIESDSTKEVAHTLFGIILGGIGVSLIWAVLSPKAWRVRLVESYPRVMIYVPIFLVAALVYPIVSYLPNNFDATDDVAYAFFGIIFGGIGVSLMWAVLSPKAFWVRLAESFALIVGQLVLLLIGFAMVGEFSDVRLFLETSPLLPLTFLIALIPLLVYRVVSGRRFLEQGSEENIASSVNSRQFQIRHLLMIMTLVAVAFGLARFGVTCFDWRKAEIEVWLGFGQVILFILGAIVLVILPCLSAAWRIRRPAMGFTFVVVWSGLLALLLLAIITMMSGPQSSDALFLVWSFCFALIGTLYYSLKILQTGGYVLASSHSSTVCGDASALAEERNDLN